MEISPEIDEFIKNSINHTMGITIPDQTIDMKLQSLENTNHRLRDQYFALQAKLKEKETALQRARSEARLNAQAVKKFVEENQKIGNECKYLLGQCNKWEQECSLFEHDREALMEFGNDADERAKHAENQILKLEEELKCVTDQLKHNKDQYESVSADQTLLNALVASLVNENEVAKTALAFLEANTGVEMCRALLKMWNSLKPDTQNVLSLAAHVRSLQKDKEYLRVNLSRAEDEVNALAEENDVLVRENKKLMKLCHSDRKHVGSAEKHDSSTRTKSHKRKTSPDCSSPVNRNINFNDTERLRYPPSPLKENSPDSKAQMKG